MFPKALQGMLSLRGSAQQEGADSGSLNHLILGRGGVVVLCLITGTPTAFIRVPFCPQNLSFLNKVLLCQKNSGQTSLCHKLNTSSRQRMPVQVIPWALWLFEGKRSFAGSWWISYRLFNLGVLAWTQECNISPLWAVGLIKIMQNQSRRVKFLFTTGSCFHPCPYTEFFLVILGCPVIPALADRFLP